MSDYYNALPILSYNGIINFILTNRNYGKTWAFKIRAWRRAYKYGKKTIWVRRFDNEAKSAAQTFYRSKDLQRMLRGFTPYDPKTKKGNVKQDGTTFYIKRNGTWDWFLKIVKLSDSTAMRSADDVKVDTIVFDEFTTTPDKYTRYRGNEVTAFIDLIVSAKREHIVRAYLLGNSESIVNPYFDYFNMPALPPNYEGVRRYRNGSIVVQKVNNLPRQQTEYERQFAVMLNGTAYGDYLYKQSYKDTERVKIGKPSADAFVYCQIGWNGAPLTIYFDNSQFVFVAGADKGKEIYTNATMDYPKAIRLLQTHRKYFELLTRGISYGLVRYDSAETYERAFGFIKWLGILSN